MVKIGITPSNLNKINELFMNKSLHSKIDYSGSQEKLGKAMSLMKGAKLTKEDREHCWYKWKKVVF